mgnify:FL=1
MTDDENWTLAHETEDDDIDAILGLSLEQLISKDREKLQQISTTLGITVDLKKTSTQRLIRLINREIKLQTQGAVGGATNADPNFTAMQGLIREMAESNREIIESNRQLVQAMTTRSASRIRPGAGAGGANVDQNDDDQQRGERRSNTKITICPPPMLEDNVKFSTFKRWELVRNNYATMSKIQELEQDEQLSMFWNVCTEDFLQKITESIVL